MRILLIVLFGLFTIVANAQHSAPRIYGTVVDAATETPLTGATLLLSAQEDRSQISDDLGNFLFENTIPGRYILQIDFLGYQSQRQIEILVEAGRSSELNIRLVPTALELPMAVVRAGLQDVQNQLLPSTQVLTIEETRRLPATFNDPARQVLRYPGVANANDQANNISVRGNSPAALSWRIEGVEIVNPNHLSNAGTRSDAVTLSGGGVNILSAQMLNTSTFYAGIVPTQYGNTQGGLMDMKLRSGNRDQWEGTIQLGLLGLDASFEGPFTKNKKSSYLFNYRYSTLGLLDALGVQISEESIKFQDLALHLNFLTEKIGRFAFFGIGGFSSNVFAAERDTSVWEFRSDRTDVDYKNGMILLGLTHQIKVGAKGSWNTTVAYSALESQRQANLLDEQFVEREIDNTTVEDGKLSILSQLSFQINKRWKLRSGIALAQSKQQLHSEFLLKNNDKISSSLTFNSLRPFVDFQFQLSNKWNINAGLSYLYESNTQFQEQGLYPNLTANYFINDKQQLRLSYQLSSRRQPFFLYMTPFFDGENKSLASIKGNIFSLSHQLNFKNNSLLRTEIYFQSVISATGLSSPIRQHSGLNIEEVIFPPFGILRNNTQGRNYGLEVLWQKYLQSDFYFIANATLFNSQFKYYDISFYSDAWKDTRFNSKYITNATVGKEFRWKKKWDKTLGINISMTYHGNLRYTPIDLPASQAAGVERLIEENTYGSQLDPYIKGDLRFYLRTDKVKYSNSLSLDIQNFFNRKNQGYFFYDPDTGTIQEKRQLGLIPILSWRLSF